MGVKDVGKSVGVYVKIIEDDLALLGSIFRTFI